MIVINDVNVDDSDDGLSNDERGERKEGLVAFLNAKQGDTRETHATTLIRNHKVEMERETILSFHLAHLTYHATSPFSS